MLCIVWNFRIFPSQMLQHMHTHSMNEHADNEQKLSWVKSELVTIERLNSVHCFHIYRIVWFWLIHPIWKFPLQNILFHLTQVLKNKRGLESQPSIHYKTKKKLPGMPDYGYLAETVSRGANIVASSSRLRARKQDVPSASSQAAPHTTHVVHTPAGRDAIPRVFDRLEKQADNPPAAQQRRMQRFEWERGKKKTRSNSHKMQQRIP